MFYKGKAIVLNDCNMTSSYAKVVLGSACLTSAAIDTLRVSESFLAQEWVLIAVWRDTMLSRSVFLVAALTENEQRVVGTDRASRAFASQMDMVRMHLDIVPAEQCPERPTFKD